MIILLWRSETLFLDVVSLEKPVVDRETSLLFV
jgi:hypothetical protein